jgi:hypothetical protein
MIDMTRVQQGQIGIPGTYGPQIGPQWGWGGLGGFQGRGFGTANLLGGFGGYGGLNSPYLGIDPVSAAYLPGQFGPQGVFGAIPSLGVSAFSRGAIAPWGTGGVGMFGGFGIDPVTAVHLQHQVHLQHLQQHIQLQQLQNLQQLQQWQQVQQLQGTRGLPLGGVNSFMGGIGPLTPLGIDPLTAAYAQQQSLQPSLV